MFDNALKILLKEYKKRGELFIQQKRVYTKLLFIISIINFRRIICLHIKIYKIASNDFMTRKVKRYICNFNYQIKIIILFSLYSLDYTHWRYDRIGSITFVLFSYLKNIINKDEKERGKLLLAFSFIFIFFCVCISAGILLILYENPDLNTVAQWNNYWDILNSTRSPMYANIFY